MVSNTRLYGAAIAFASGLYSIWSASLASRMVASAWLMLILGAVVLVHGAVLLTTYADRLGDASGPLMIAYALVMFVNQALLGAGVMDTGGGMGADGMSTADGMATTGMGGSGITAGMGWDAGMVALALLMLASGVIMTRGSGEAGNGGM
ncbi:hypothetical protein AArcSl_3227 [Halalkaliarchaeum desulfuricum]|uniref:Uncharacterized protein n=1 Tax=Halalkaliarchaeum desulfuricum TaxID=2055893 RepID=A0A343TP11_9EURY|nr:hypothetical protein [Halalkaliarchaeum desulfuricum]AUX10833.1 hypothetical protein AArcSl_3227 [Halalkaliarchaeum desulfuricum]